MLRETTIQHDDAIITVREERGADVFAEIAVANKLNPIAGEEEIRGRFATCVIRTVKVENLGFPWVTLASNPAETQAAYDAWCNSKRGLLVVWANALFDVNAPLGDVELAPVAEGES